jgi:lipoprotein-releasing system permease protein
MSGAPYELRIGRRYLRSTGNRFLSFISLMSMLGVAIGVAVLIVVLSVMKFERAAQRILSITSHATLSAFGAACRRLAAHRATALGSRIVGGGPFVEGEALLIADRRATVPPAGVRGHRPGSRRRFRHRPRLRSGSPERSSRAATACCSSKLAAHLGVAGRQRRDSDRAGHRDACGSSPRMRRFTVAGSSTRACTRSTTGSRS